MSTIRNMLERVTPETWRSLARMEAEMQKDLKMIVDPNGFTWKIGDRVLHEGQPTFITEIYEGNGSWEAAPKGGDIDSVWMRLGNKWMARPFLLLNLEER